MALKVKKGDRVKVISGKDRGTEGLVIEVQPAKSKVVVEGVNQVKKHVRPSQTDPKGGIKKIEAPIHVSNVMVISSKDGRPVRVARRETKDGVRERVSKLSGEPIR